MTVVSEGPLCLKIHLSKYELKKHFISYEKITFSDPQVKKTVEFLFKIASNGLDFKTNGRKIIEVFPSYSGGCIFKFTLEPDFYQSGENNLTPTVKRLKKSTSTTTKYLFVFLGTTPLLNLLEGLYKSPLTRGYDSGIYYIKNRYFLSVNIPISDRKTPLFISEYSVFSARGSLPIEIIKEYCNCILESNAIYTFGSRYFKVI